MKNTFLILDFGSQYTQLISRRLRDLKVDSKIVPHNTPFKKIQLENPVGIILSGGPSSVADDSSLDSSHFSKNSNNRKSKCEKKEKHKNFIINSIEIDQLAHLSPILGICYGMQLICKHYGGSVESSKLGEFGQSEVRWKKRYIKGVPLKQKVWMSYGDHIKILPPGFEILAFSETKSAAAIRSVNRRILALQFHPEVSHTEQGIYLLKHFVFDLCKAKLKWKTKDIVKQIIENIRKQVPFNEKVLCALSGGVDSSVVALLLKKALGSKRVIFVFVNTGFLRKGEFEEVIKNYEKLHLDVQAVNSKEVFLKKIKAVSDPEEKRKIIGHVFIETFKFILKGEKQVKWLAQGTLYPDVIESSSDKKTTSSSVTIKTHHNVGGLPKDLGLKLLEPLRDLYKDEVREIGKSLGLSKLLLYRHPFPGPGLAIRILGEVTEEKLRILREADSLFIEELKKSDLYSSVWQALAVLLPIKTVGVQGDQRTYGNVIVLRAILSVDGMTASWAKLPEEFLNTVSRKITNNIKEINRVVYDITSKPPGTIEWE